MYYIRKVLLILCVKCFYNQLRFKVVIDKSCGGGHFFPDTVYHVYVCMYCMSVCQKAREPSCHAIVFNFTSSAWHVKCI